MITAAVSRKGGVGKTTTCVNLAAALASVGKRVLLIDLDSQASASLSLGVARSDLLPSSADLLLNSLPAGEAIRPTRSPGLDLITASSDLTSIDGTLAPDTQKELRLRRKLEPVRGRYDFILLDCPSSLTLVPMNALVAADNYIVPVVPHFLSVASVGNLLPTAERLYRRFGTRTPLLGIVLTIVDYRTRANRENVSRIREEFGKDVFAVEIRTNIRLAEAPSQGKTIFEFAPSSSGARAYRLLAAELLIRAANLHRGAGQTLPARPRADQDSASLAGRKSSAAELMQ